MTKKLLKKTDEKFSSNVKFQREVCAVTYCFDHHLSDSLDDKANYCEKFYWSVTTK